MKIKRITLYNIGPYVDLNTFDFSISKDRNVVLIGGKNGAGKTTFFKSIKTCLYGCKVWGFDSPGKEYYSIINGLVNSKSMYDNDARAYIELELIFDDGKQVNSYILHREWRKVKLSLSEYFQITKNGSLIIGGEEDDFVNYLLSIIPPDMFNFYFFDGESIADFFLGSDGNKNFRNAFLKLYGLDTLSIMIENFNRNIKKNDSKNTAYDLYLLAKGKADQDEELLIKYKSQLRELEEKLDLLQVKLQALQTEYSKEGGIGLSEWKEINAELSREDSMRESLNKWLKDVANNYLPFIILEKQLKKLNDEIVANQESKKNALLLDRISADDFTKSVSSFLIEKQVSNISSLDIIELFRGLIADTTDCIDFDFSTSQITRILSQIYEKCSFEKKEIIKTISKINASINKSKKLRDRLMSTSVDGYESFVTDKEAIEKSITNLLVEIEKNKQLVEAQKLVCEISQREFIKAKDDYSLILKNKSIMDMSERAVATYTLLEEKLVRRQAALLQKEFIKCFNSIINKDSFIDGIVIDKTISIIPYKFINVRKQQLKNYLMANKDFISLFDTSEFTFAINDMELGKVDEITLPAPIKAPFSQGERQVYIMSIYLALLKTSHKDIPFFIDTPFARIDSNHRTNIVTEFFNKIKNQLFILSTDEEIVGEYKAMMEDKISDKYTLSISEYGSTAIIPDVYFGGQ